VSPPFLEHLRFTSVVYIFLFIREIIFGEIEILFLDFIYSRSCKYRRLRLFMFLCSSENSSIIQLNNLKIFFNGIKNWYHDGTLNFENRIYPDGVGMKRRSDRRIVTACACQRYS